MNVNYSGPDSEVQKDMENKISALIRIADIAKQDNEINILFEQFLDILIEMIGVDSGLVKFLEPRGNFFMKPEIFHGVSQKYLDKISNMPSGGCLCSIALASKELVFSSDITRDRTLSCPHCKSEGFKFVAVIPLLRNDDVIGVVQLASYKIKKIKPVEKYLMSCAGKLFNYAMNYYDMNNSINLCKNYHEFYLKISQRPIIIVDTEWRIKHIGSYAVKLLDIPAENLIEAPLSDIMPKEDIEKIPQFAFESSPPLTTSLKGIKSPIEVSASVHPVREAINNSVIRYILDMECIQKEESIQEKFDKFKMKSNDFLEIVANLDFKTTVQDFCDSSMAKISGLLSVDPSKYLVYFFDSLSQELTLIAHSGYSVDFLESHAVVSSETYEYKTALNTQKLYSSSSDGEWNVIVPLIYGGQSKGLFILNSPLEPSDSLYERNRFTAIATLIASMMEKQALYDSLSQNSDAIADINAKSEILSCAISNDSLEPDDKIRKIFEAMLDISTCSFVSVMIKKDGEMAVYSMHSGSGLSSVVSPPNFDSRESFVFEKAQPLFYPDPSGSQTQFDGDEKLEGRYAAVMPIICESCVKAVVRLENDAVVNELPVNVLSIAAKIFLYYLETERLAEDIAGLKKDNEDALGRLSAKQAEFEEEVKKNSELEKNNSILLEELQEVQIAEEESRDLLEDTQKVLTETVKEKENLEKERQTFIDKINLLEENERNLSLKLDAKQDEIIRERSRAKLEDDRLREEIQKIKNDALNEKEKSALLIERYSSDLNSLAQDLSREKQKNLEIEKVMRNEADMRRLETLSQEQKYKRQIEDLEQDLLLGQARLKAAGAEEQNLKDKALKMEEKSFASSELIKFASLAIKRILEASDKDSIVDILQDSALYLTGHRVSLVSSDLVSLRSSLKLVSSLMEEGGVKKLVWESVSDTALKRLHEFCIMLKISDVLSS